MARTVKKENMILHYTDEVDKEIRNFELKKMIKEASEEMAKRAEYYKGKYLYVVFQKDEDKPITIVDKYKTRFMFMSHIVLRIDEGIVIKNTFGKHSKEKDIKKVMLAKTLKRRL